MDPLDRRYRQSEGLAARNVAGEAVVVTPHDSQVHELNEVATFVFETCAAPCTGRELVEKLLAAFDVERPVAEADLATCLDTLTARGLLVAEP